jgi:uncharacterized protein (DUF2461 family)
MSFEGWPAEALEFCEGLEADNSKPFWQRNKQVYETLVRAPMEALVAELEPEFGDGQSLPPVPRRAVQQGQVPVQDHDGAATDGWATATSSCTANGLGLPAPATAPWTPAQLAQYRDAVDRPASGTKLVGIVANVKSNGADVMSRGALKTAPKGYPKDHPRIELLRYKGIAAWREWPAGAWLGTAAAKDRVVEFLRLCGPLTTWLRANVT